MSKFWNKIQIQINKYEEELMLSQQAIDEHKADNKDNINSELYRFEYNNRLNHLNYIKGKRDALQFLLNGEKKLWRKMK